MNKKLFMLCAAGLTAVGAGAQKYEISGTAPEGSTIYFQCMETRAVDSTQVANGKFSFKGDAAGKPYALITMKGAAGYTPVYLDGKISVDVVKHEAKGSAENEGLSRDFKRVADIMDNLQKYVKENRDILYSKDEAQAAQKAKCEEAVNQFYQDLSRTASEVCKGNVKMMYPAVVLRMYGNYMEQEDIIALYDANPAYKETGLAKPLFSRVEGWRRQAVGSPVVDFVMADTTGVERHLTDFVGKGKYVLVDFWASWCGPCRAEMPTVKAAYDKYHAKGFDIVGVSFDNNKAAWTAAIKKLDLPWHHISDLKGWGCAASTIYGINAIPATLLFGPDGKVIASGLRGEAIAKKLEELLK